MKRILQDYVGRPVAEKPEPDVMGRPIPCSVTDSVTDAMAHSMPDVASFLGARRAIGRPDADSDERIVGDFADFLSGGDENLEAPPLPDPDPVFRERLRRRLWQMHLIARPTKSTESH